MAEQSPVPPSVTTPVADATPRAEGDTGHQGSATPEPTGKAVIAAWLTSLGVHVGVFVIMLMVPWLAGISRQLDEPIAHTELINELQPTDFANTDVPQFHTPTTERPQPTEFVPQKFDQLAQLGTPEPANELEIIGIGTGGDMEGFELPGPGGGGPQFFGLGGSAKEAKNIVYVVDRSGSMLETFDAVKQELRRSVTALRRTQKFHVVFFNYGDPMENPPRRLVSAIRAQKEALFDFLGRVQPEGSTHPDEAMRRALALQPDLIYFLTDGQFDPGLLNKLDHWNRDRRVRIFTIAYVNREGGELLERIAREHRGEYRFVSEDELFP